jgi:hypothetical protein
MKMLNGLSRFLKSTGALLLATVFLFGVGGVRQVMAVNGDQTPTTAQQILQYNPTGGPRMISDIKNLVIADRANLQTVLDLIPKASTEQKRAIGSGLAEAVRILIRNATTAEYANEIQEAIAKTKDQDVVLAYALITGNQPIAAVAAAASAGAIGGQTTPTGGAPSGTGGAQAIGPQFRTTPYFSYSSNVSGLGTLVSGP